MVYQGEHPYMTVHWNVNGIADEHGQFGLRFTVGTGIPDETQRTAIANAVKTFWQSAAGLVSSMFVLTHIKWAMIAPNGEYVPGSDPVIYDYSPSAPGVTTGASRYPLQVSQAVTLTTDFSRGLAHKGRFYIPPPEATVDSQNKIPASTQSGRVGVLDTMLTAINTHSPGAIRIQSKVGAGTSRLVTGIALGDRLDVQRRRARQLTENYTTAAI